MLKGFRQFLLRGNAVDLSIGVVVGAAFTGIVNSIVRGLITPLIGAIIKTEDFSGLFFKLNGSKFLYGDVLNALISFIIVAAVVYFLIIRPKNFLISKGKKGISAEETSKKCPECLSEIPAKATRCAFCTAKLAKKSSEENA